MDNRFAAVKAILEGAEKDIDTKERQYQQRIDKLRLALAEISNLTPDDHHNGTRLAARIAADALSNDSDY